jgi:hypothetical protein
MAFLKPKPFESLKILIHIINLCYFYNNIFLELGACPSFAITKIQGVQNLQGLHPKLEVD